MICKRIEIGDIPACIWGMASTRVIVAVHGNMASKTDAATAHWFHTNDDLAVLDAWLKNQTARVAG